MSNTVTASQAVLRLAYSRSQHPDLARAEAAARLRLATAIIAMDEAEDAHQHRDHPGLHSLQEQAEVEAAKESYANALADLIRGVPTSTEESDNG